MENTQEIVKVQAGPFRATVRDMRRCGIITPETVLQGHLRGENYEGPVRIFFGDQSSEDSMKRFAELSNAGIATPVEASGYFKYRTNIYKETFLDDSALFVEELTVLS